MHASDLPLRSPCPPRVPGWGAPRRARAPAGLLCALLVGCPKGPPVQQKPEVDPATLFLEPVPAATATLARSGPEGASAGPARVELRPGKPWTVVLEDFDTALPVEICVESEAPARFCKAPEALSDEGQISRDGDRVRVQLARKGYDEQVRQIDATIDLKPVAAPRPDDWVRPGTTLHFGRAFDDKPVTRVVPMALTVRVGGASDGGRVLTWKADLDVNTQTEITGARTIEGRRLLGADAVAAGPRHSDAFTRGEDVAGDVTSLFLSKKTIADARKYGGAPFHDLELGGDGVLVVTGQTVVQVQAGAALWSIPALVCSTRDGEGVYVVADDPENPLVLSASRPGYRTRLMAIAPPAAPR